MTTYTIAYGSYILYACEPDDEDIEAALAEVEERANIAIGRGEITIESGLTLTDEDTGEIVFAAGPHTGDLIDEHGCTYRYAVRP